MKVYVVSIPTSTERREKMAEQLQGIDYEFVDGIHWNTDEGRSLVQKYKGSPGQFWTGYSVRDSEVCCYYSHLQALKRHVEATSRDESNNVALILEDDALLVDRERLRNFLHYETLLIGNQYVDHVHLHAYTGFNPGYKVEREFFEFQILRETSLLCLSYAVSARLASIVLSSWSKPIHIPIDHVFVELSRCYGLTFADVKKGIFMLNDMGSDNNSDT